MGVACNAPTNPSYRENRAHEIGAYSPLCSARPCYGSEVAPVACFLFSPVSSQSLCALRDRPVRGLRFGSEEKQETAARQGMRTPLLTSSSTYLEAQRHNRKTVVDSFTFKRRKTQIQKGRQQCQVFLLGVEMFWHMQSEEAQQAAPL